MISTSFHWVCDWYVLDTFSVDLQSLDLITTPAVNVETGVDCYNSTVRALLDKHAFVELKHNKTCSSSVQWHDRECHDVKHHIRKLEWQYHRLCTVESKTVWYQQFDIQYQLYKSKCTEFWLSTGNSCWRNPRAPWQTVNMLLQPSRQCTSNCQPTTSSSYLEAKSIVHGQPLFLPIHQSLSAEKCHLSVTPSQWLLLTEVLHLLTWITSDPDLIKATAFSYCTRHMPSRQPLIETWTTQAISSTSTAQKTTLYPGNTCPIIPSPAMPLQT